MNDGLYDLVNPAGQFAVTVLAGREKPPAHRASVPSAGRAPLSLSASFTPSATELKIHLRYFNSGDLPVLLFDRLWVKENGKAVPDPAQIYRFITQRYLRLLLGMAPLPRSKTPIYRNIPFVTRIEPHGKLEKDVTISEPVKEHNVYFPVQQGQPFESEKVSEGEIFVQYLVETSAVKTGPSTIDPGALKILSPGAWDAALLVGSAPVPLSTRVLRRTDEFERLTLPSEEP